MQMFVQFTPSAMVTHKFKVTDPPRLRVALENPPPPRSARAESHPKMKDAHSMVPNTIWWFPEIGVPPNHLF